jgi:hypothetical protein
MSEDNKKERKFQYALTKAQVDFEYWFAVSIGLLAIVYGLLPYYKDNLVATGLTDCLIFVLVVFLIRIYYRKEERFKDIKKEYIDN